MEKSPDAFRTISEVAESLETPAHVLRFWESRFPQIRPVKRAGGRRYYRPSDVALLSGIKRLLHDEGLTIRGVQKILREQGIRHVARLGSGGELVDEAEALEAQLSAALGVDDAETLPVAEAETAQIIALETVLNRAERAPAPPPADSVQPDLWSQPSAADDEPTETPTATPVEDAPEAPMVELVESEESVVVTMTFSGTATGSDADATGEPMTEGTQGEDLTATAPAEAGPAAESPAPAPAEGVASTIAARLRALPAGALADRAEQIGAVQDRILSLRAKLAETSRRRGR